MRRCRAPAEAAARRREEKRTTAPITSATDLPEPQTLAGRVAQTAIGMVWGVTFFAMLLGIGLLVLTGNHPGGRDFVSYWTAAHQVIHHANPYDLDKIFAVEQSVGFPPNTQSLVMRNAPWSLVLVLPLGLLSLQAGALLWALLQVTSLGLSVHLLWVMYGRPAGLLQVFAYSFGPALVCILGGQTAVFSLLGMVLFLRFHQDRPYLAGAALWLCALKPHLLLPFGVVLLIWIVVTRSYRMVAGLAAALLLSSLAATMLDPGVWGQYRQMMHLAGLESEFIPCLGVVLRFAIHRQTMWLQYIPAGCGCLWAVDYFRRHRAAWDWMVHGSLLVLVSLFVAPYIWCLDQTLLIPALLHAIYRATSRTQIAVLVLASAAAEIEILLGVTVHSPLLLWTAPFWLGWYVYVTSRKPLPKADLVPTGLHLVAGSL